MANGGFKAFSVEYPGVGAESDSLSKEALAKQILRDVGDGLVSTGQGWAYDGDKTGNGEAPIDSWYDGSGSYSLYFTHTSGARLLVSYNVYGLGFEPAAYIKASPYEGFDGATGGGLALAVIPPGGGDFDPYAANPIPLGGLRIHGFTDAYSTSNSASSAAFSCPYEDTIKIVMAVRGTQIIVLSKLRSWSTPMVLIVGDILTCAHDEDAHPFSEFATVSAHNTYQQAEDWPGGGCLGGGDPAQYGFGASEFYAQCYSCQGELRSGYDGKCKAAIPDTPILSCTGMTPRSVRWVPISVFTEVYSGGSEVAIDENDGYKGMISPEVACVTRAAGALNTGQTLDGGNFVYVASGLIIGWDPSNYVDLSM